MNRRCPFHARRWPARSCAARSTSSAATWQMGSLPRGSTCTRLRRSAGAVNATYLWRSTTQRLPPIGDGSTWSAVTAGTGEPSDQRSCWSMEAGAPRAPMPVPRAAAAAAIAGGKVYIVGGVRRPGVLARAAFAFDLRRRRWSTVPGPTPRAPRRCVVGRKVYAVAGRLGGIDTNQTTVESLTPGARSWRRVTPIPEARGGTGAAVAAGRLISVGGEAPPGTIASVFAYAPASRRWERLPNLPTPRHGLAVVAVGRRVFVIGGGPRTGLVRQWGERVSERH